MPAPIVVVLNDVTLADRAAEALTLLGHEAIAIPDPMSVLDALDGAKCIDMLVTSGNFGDGKPNGISLVRMTRAKRPDLMALFIGPPDIIDIISRHGKYLATPTTPMQIALAVEEMMNPAHPDRAA